MYSYLTPLLKKEPSVVLLHIGSNDASSKTSEVILTELLQLKHHIESCLPSCRVIISHPTLRLDNAKAGLTITNLVKKLNGLNIPCMVNSNIKFNHLSRKGHHLNDYGIKRMAMNIISLIRHL